MNKDWLYQKYWRDDFSMRDIAKLSGVSYGTVQYWMDSFGLNRRKSGNPGSLGKNNGMFGVHRFGKSNPNWRGGKPSYYREYGRKIWEKYYNYSIPRGFLIHHIDKNIKNNNIENLVLLTYKSHLKVHGIN